MPASKDSPKQVATGNYIAQADSGGFAIVNVFQSEPSGNAQSLHQLPSPPADFTGRQKEVSHIKDSLSDNHIIILTGIGGVGKTSLALKLAKELIDQYSDAQFYLDLKGLSGAPLTSIDIMSHVIRSYYPTQELPDNENEIRGLYQSALYNKRALLLLDNARGKEQIDLLNPPLSCLTLVTSRQHFSLPGATSIDVDILEQSEANELIIKIAPRCKKYANEITKLCEYMPLAIRFSGSLLAERVDISPTYFLDRIQNNQQRLKLTGVESTLKLSYDLLPRDLKSLWRKLALFPGTFDIVAVSVIMDLDPDEALQKISDLCRYSLLKFTPTIEDQKRFFELSIKEKLQRVDIVGRYHLHNLARLFAINRLKQGESSKFKTSYAFHYYNIVEVAAKRYHEGNDGIFGGLELFDTEWENIQAASEWLVNNQGTDKFNATLYSEYIRAGYDLVVLRQTPDVRIKSFTKALEAALMIDDKAGAALHLGRIGVSYFHLNQLDKAQECYTKAQEILKDTSDAWISAGLLINIANVNFSKSNFPLAIDQYESALKIFHEIKDRKGEAESLSNLSNVYAALGQPDKANEALKQYVDICKELGDLQGYGIAYNNVGASLAKKGQFKEALELFEKALPVAREMKDWRSLILFLGNLGTTSNNLGRYDDAIKYFNEELNIIRDNHALHLEPNILGKLAGAYEDWGEVDRAIGYVVEQLDVARQNGDYPNQYNALLRLGLIHYKQGEWENAQKHFSQLLDQAKEAANIEYQQLALGLLGDTYSQIKDFKQAISYYEQKLAIAQDSMEKKSEAASLLSIGINKYNSDDMVGAIKYLEKYRISTQETGEQLSNEALYCLGVAYTKTNHIPDAIKNLELCLALEDDHKQDNRVLELTDILTRAYYSQEDYRASARLVCKKIKLLRSNGELHEPIYEALMMLGQCYAKLSRYKVSAYFHKQALIVTQSLSNNKQAEMQTLGALGKDYFVLKKFEIALEWYQQRLVIAQELNNEDIIGRTLINIGNIYTELGNAVQALTFYEQGLIIVRNLGDSNAEALALWNMSQAHSELGQSAQAINFAENSLQIFERTMSPNTEMVRKQLQEWSK